MALGAILMRAQRQYTDEERAAALAALQANGGNLSLTARQVSVPRMTLATWAKEQPARQALTSTRQEKRACLADRLEELAHTLIDLMPERAAEAPANQLAISLAIAIDKMRLLREQPTAIVDERLTDEERADRILSLMARGEEGGTRPPADGSLALN